MEQPEKAEGSAVVLSDNRYLAARGTGHVLLAE